MPYSITVAKLSGNPDSSGWSQIYDFESQDIEKVKTRGHLFALISMSSENEGLDNVITGREVFTRLHEEYFGKTEDKPFITLKNAVNKVIDEFFSRENTEIAAVSVVEKTVYIAVGGGASVCLLRKGNLHKIAESMRGRTVAASGKPSDKDLLVIGTKPFYKLFSAGEIMSCLKKEDPVSAVELFAPVVRAEEKSGKKAVIILRFDENRNEKKITPIALNDIKPSAVPKDDNLPDSKSAFAKISQKVFWILRKLPGKGVYLKSYKPDQSAQRKNKTSLLVGILLLLILAVSIYFGMQRKKKEDFRSTYESQLASAEHELQESYSLYLLNPQRSRELFDQARNKVLGLSSQEIDDPSLESLKQKIKEGEGRILGQFSTDPQIYVDLALFSEGFKADDISVSSGKVYVLDRVGKKIVEVDLSNKRTQIFAGPSDVKDSNLIAAYSDRVFVSGADGLYELRSGRIEIDDNNMGNALIGAYAGNVYALDKSESKLYRYPATDTGFGSKKEWLREGVNVNLSGARNIMIDGMVWVITDDAEVFKFSLGNLLNFEFAGVFPGIEKITDIYTNEESEHLYILEKDKGRVVVTDKDGGYKAQYLAEGIKGVNKLVVSEKEKKVFLLTSDKLTFIELSHFD